MRKKAILGLLLSVSLLTPAISLEPSFLVAEQSIEVDCNNLANARIIKNEELEKVQTLATSQEVEVIQQEVEIVEEQEDVEVTNEEVLDTTAREIVEEPVEDNKEYCRFEVSFYTSASDEGGGYGGLTASGELVQPWVSVALPSDIPFYSEVYIEGLGSFINHDTGSYIQWTYDEYGNPLCRVDVCVNTKEEAFRLGRYQADGYIIRNENY